MIDPPPILQLTLDDYDPTNPEDVSKLRSPWNIVACLLYSVPNRSASISDGHEVTEIPDPNNQGKTLRRLMGSLVMNPFVGVDPSTPDTASEAERIGSYFIFHDLSCRQNGLYRLHFCLTPVNMLLPHGSSARISATAVSDVFEVFSAKEFPGMVTSSALVHELKRQGATVSVKRGNEGRRRRGGARRSGSDEEANEDPDEEEEQ